MTKEVACGSRSGRLQLKLIPQEFVDGYWISLHPFIQKAMDKTDEADAADLIDFLLDGRAQLLVEYLDGVPQGCVVTMLIHYPKFTALEILAIAGLPGKKMRYPNEHSLDLLKRYAALVGCKRVQGYANEAIARLWRRIGFNIISFKVGVDL